MPSTNPCEQRLPGLGRGALDVVGGAGCPACAGVVHPTLDLVDGLLRRGLDLVGLLVDPAEHHQRDEDSEREQPEQHDARPCGSREAVTLHLRHERPGDGRQDRADRNRDRDRRGEGQQPGQPHHQEADTDEEPGQQAEVPNPCRRGEDAGEGRRVDLENGGAVGGDGIRLGRLPGGMKAIEEPWHARDSGVFSRPESRFAAGVHPGEPPDCAVRR